MKFLIYTFFAVIIAGCDGKKANREGSDLSSPGVEEDDSAREFSDKRFGNKISKQGAVPANTVVALMEDHDSLEIKIRGEITAVCQKKGCWMLMDLGSEEKMRVTFKDYGFFVPKNIDGQYAIVKGIVKKETTDIATLRHYAQDAGKNKSEIESINRPEENLVFVAEGVIIE